MCSHCHHFMHVQIANNSYYGGHTSPNAIYKPVTLTWQPDQIVTWQPDKRTRKLGRRRDFIYWGKSEKKKYRFLALASLELNTFFLGGGGRQWWNDGRYSTSLFLEFSCLHILTGCPLDMKICNLSRIKWYRTRDETYRKEKELCTGHNGGGKNYFKLGQDISDDVSFCSYVIQRRYFNYTASTSEKYDIDCREERILTGLYKLKAMGRKRLEAIFR